MENLEKYIKDKLNVDASVFLEALKLSPNAIGYILGAISEFLLRKYITSKGYEILRIKEKWEGDKHPNHHGDFYIRKNGTKNWFVLESKGVKSNSEKWHRLFNKDRLISFLEKYIDKTPFSSLAEIEDYVQKNILLFGTDYCVNFYTYNDIKKYKCKKKTEKFEAIALLKGLSSGDLDKACAKRLAYIMDFVKVIETHLVSGGSEKSERTQATPRVDEFNILALNLFLRTGKHEFIFVNPKLLPPSESDKHHLQQNYIIDILIKGIKDNPKIQVPWTTDFDGVFATLKDPIKESDMQVDERSDDSLEIDTE